MTSKTIPGNNGQADELKFQLQENEKRAAELLVANKELAFQNKEKEDRAAELVIANKELAFQNQEKEKRAAELVIANKELAYQNDEKEKRAAELVIANEELLYQNEEKEKCAMELLNANQELVSQNFENEKRASELTIAYQKIKKTEGFLKEYISGLEKMMFITHHKVRQPIANILGLSQILELYITAPATLKKLVSHIQTSATDLDVFTQELTTFIGDLDSKGKEKETL